MNEKIIQEAIEAIEKNLNAGCYVGDLLRIVKSQKAEIFNLKEEIATLKSKNGEFLISNEKAKAENERLLQKLQQAQSETERWKNAMMGECMLSACYREEEIKSEAYREFADRLKDVPSIIIAGQKHYVIVET